MPTAREGEQYYTVALPVEVLEGLRELAKQNRRSLRDELEHAARRHLAAPPVTPEPVAPELPADKVIPSNRRGRPLGSRNKPREKS